jgi:hypothetical protein
VHIVRPVDAEVDILAFVDILDEQELAGLQILAIVESPCRAPS